MKKLLTICTAAAGILLFSAGLLRAQEPIKIGCLFDLSGPAGHIGTPSKYVAEMLAERRERPSD